jgi:hypothetical protein
MRGNFPPRTFLAESYWLRNIGPIPIKEAEVQHYREHGSRVVEYVKGKTLGPIKEQSDG